MKETKTKTGNNLMMYETFMEPYIRLLGFASAYDTNTLDQLLELIDKTSFKLEFFPAPDMYILSYPYGRQGHTEMCFEFDSTQLKDFAWVVNRFSIDIISETEIDGDGIEYPIATENSVKAMASRMQEELGLEGGR